jgi:hypothetical protein
MKKQNVIAAVGTIAILANLLVPGLAFGADSDSQEATQVIDCPTGTSQELTFSVPSAVTFDSMVASGNSQQAFDASVLAGISAIGGTQHLLVVTDTRSGGAENCPTSPLARGFSVNAVMAGTGLVNGNATIIPSSQFRIITTPAVNETDLRTVTLPEAGNPLGSGTASAFAQPIVASNNVWYTNPANTAGNWHDVATPVMYDDGTYQNGNNATQFRAKASYVLGTDNKLDPTGVTLMSTSTSHFNHMAVGVVLQSEIPPNQESGTYTGTLIYTLS